MDDSSSNTLIWWTMLCGVAALNMLAWLVSAQLLKRRRSESWPARRLQLLLSAGYVLGCAYRSALPVFDVPRLVLVDSWWSSVLVGRSVATVAELCFAAQWALLLHGVALATRHRPSLLVARCVLPMIALAELCSWHAVLTTANFGHVLEESLWGLCAALLVASMLALWPRCRPATRPLLAACCAAGLAYVCYMFLVDVPMYWTRWLADELAGRPYLSLAQGLQDAASRWVVTQHWEAWRSEALWMSLYFSVAVWLSIALPHLPRLAREPQSAPGRA